MGAHNEIDVGSLVWVKGEIDQAIERARQCLGQFGLNSSDVSQLKFARTHLHQVTGAVQMVGLDGVARFCEEIESLVGAGERGEAALPGEGIAAIEQALGDLGRYLEDLLNGASDHPLKLYPAYERLKVARGAQKFSPSELFFPSLDVFSLPANASPTVQDSELPAFVKAQRSRYELGLLKWLRGATHDGLQIMRQTLEAISQAVKSPRQRTFWWTASGLIDAIQHDALEVDYSAKQIFARINIQLRRLAEGSQTVAERLQRDILYFLAKSQPKIETVRAIREAFVLDELMPEAVSIEHGDAAAIQKTAREAKDLLNQAKDAWIRFSSGSPDRLQGLRDTLADLRDKSAALAIDGVPAMFHALGSAIDSLSASAVPESASMDIATAFLLLEGIYDRPLQQSPDLPDQLDAMTRRLQALANPALADHSLPGLPQLDQLSRDAQARMLHSQLIHEIQVNLQHIEQVLDAFFRDNYKRDELPGLAPYFRQVYGALSMVELGKAAELLLLAQDEVRKYEKLAAEVEQGDLEQIAEMLSTLGFYIEQSQFDKPNKDEILDALLRRLRGEEIEPEPQVLAEPVSVEAEVSQQKQQAQELLESLRENPEDESVQQQLRSTLQTLQQNADLIADNDLIAQSAAALDVLKTGHGGSSEQLAAAVAGMVGERPATGTAHKSAPVSDEAVDAELLEVYLEEAVEVLANIHGNQQLCKANPRDKEALTVIRRSFHTLKGSGRMVGLNHLGEVAWAIEQVMNKWLQDDLPASPALMHLISMSHHAFSGWVTELRERGSAAVEASDILQLAEALKNGNEPESLPAFGDRVVVPAPAAEAALPVMEDEVLSVEVPEGALAGAEPAEPELPVLELAIDSQADQQPSPALAMLPELEPVSLPELEPGLATLPVPEFEQEAVSLVVDEPVLALQQDDLLLEEAVTDQVSPMSESMILGDLGCSQEGDGPAAELTLDWPQEAESADLPLVDLTAAPVDGLDEITLSEDGFDAIGEITLQEGTSPAGPFDAVLSVEDPDADIQIGPVSMSPVLYDIFTKEAEQRLSRLHTELGALEAAPNTPASDNLLHSAHTLCGIYRTAGFADIGELGHALELCIAGQMKAAELFTAEDCHVVHQAVESMERSLESIRSREMPASEPALCEALGRIVERLRAPSNELLVIEPLDDMIVIEEEPDLLAVDVAEPATETLIDPAQDAAVLELHDADEIQIAFSEELLEAAPAALAESSGSEQPEAGQARIEPAVDVSVADDFQVLQGGEPAQAEAGAGQGAGVSTAEAAFAVQDDIDTQLLEVFLEEANELQPKISKTLRDWRQQPSADGMSQSLQRLLHTLKGSARMTGAMRLGEATHNLEAQVIALGDQVPGTEHFDEFEAGFDIINELLDILQGKPEAAAPVPAAGASPVAQPAASAALAQPIGGPSEAELAKSTLRVRADLVDRLVNQAGEVAIARSRMEAEMQALKQSLLDLTDNVARLRGQLREIEIQAESQMQSRLSHIKQEHEGFDPLEFDRFSRLQELTRFMAESVNDVATVQHNLLKNLDETESALLAQGRMTKDLQQELMRIRMVPFSSVSERLYRIVRQAGKEVGKKVNLEMRGGRVEIDRSMLEKLTAPFEHMLRNSIDHGLESRDKREAAGKPEVGEIVLSLKQEGNELGLTLSDDGAGLNLPKILQKAQEKGLVGPDDKLTNEQIMYLIFEPGFSTADAVTQLSGRGIGMDVVKNEISDLGGRIQVDSEPGKGTTFSLHLPLTLAVTQTVLVMAGTRKYAIPSVMVEQVQELKLSDLEALYEQKKVSWMGIDYPFAYLPRLLGDFEHVPETKRFSTVMLLRSGNQRIALHVDELVKNQEVVVKNIGPQLARVPGVAGATVLGNGDIVLILNPLLLVSRVEAASQVPQTSGPTPAQLQTERLAMVPVVMVVDDSLTVRKITGRLLAREGYQVITAKDGVDALQQIIDVVPDVMLVDIEMPRMDGFELTRHIRADEKTRHIPIVMITSRTAEKHRNYAKELGVNVFLGKPYQEEELLGHINTFVADKKQRLR